MGEIIRFDFNQNKKINNKEEGKNPDEVPFDKEAQIEKLTTPFLKFIEFVLSGKWKKLQNLKASEFSYNEAKETVRGYSNEELVSC